MAKLMSMSSPLVRGLSRAADLVILNVLFIISCLPVFTLGAALSSLYAMLFKISGKREGHIVKSYFKEFRINFKKGVPLGLIYSGLGALIAINFIYVYRMEITAAVGAIIVLLGVASMLFFMLFLYTFALQSRFENTIKNTIKNSLLMSVKHFPKTVLLLIINAVPLILILNNIVFFVYAFPVLMLIGFSLICYLNVLIFNGIFINYIPKEEGEEVNAGIVQ